MRELPPIDPLAAHRGLQFPGSDALAYRPLDVIVHRSAEPAASRKPNSSRALLLLARGCARGPASRSGPESRLPASMSVSASPWLEGRRPGACGSGGRVGRWPGAADEAA